MSSVLERLQKLGLKSAAKTVDVRKGKAKSLVEVYKLYKYLTPEQVTRFQQQLRQRTEKLINHGKQIRFQALKFTRLADYPEIPPPGVLTALEKAQAQGLFDAYEIATIEEVTENAPAKRKPDPVLFGTIIGCLDRFLIAQWGNDVSFEQIERESGQAKPCA